MRFTSQGFKPFACLLCVLFVGDGWGDEPCRSGLQSGQRPGPYSALIATGAQRGQSCCYICETGDRPAVVVFARTLSDPLGQLTGQLDQALTQHKDAGFRAWVTFLNDDQVHFDAKVVEWGKQHAIRGVPLGVFEDAGGPPSYRLARDADVTVLLFAKQKVVANFAFRAGELTKERVEDVMKTLPQLIKNPAPPSGKAK
jgi:hypothetical protein